MTFIRKLKQKLNQNQEKLSSSPK